MRSLNRASSESENQIPPSIRWHARLEVNAQDCAFLDDLGINLNQPRTWYGYDKGATGDQAISDLSKLTGLDFPD